VVSEYVASIVYQTKLSFLSTMTTENKQPVTAQSLYQYKHGILYKLYSRFKRYKSKLKWGYFLNKFGGNSYIEEPSFIYGGHSIEIGDNVTIWRNARIEARKGLGSNSPAIEIGDGCKVHPYVHIGAVERVTIGKGCLFASNVYITDHDHDYSNPYDEVVSNRKVIVSPVTVGDYVWLGEGVMVLKGSTIGERSIIGAGSIVLGEIPPLSVAVGRPARVVKQYDVKLSKWVNVKREQCH
jgi:lipopolysaccharide O-acetyltransferase